MADTKSNSKLQNHVANNQCTILFELLLHIMAHVLIQRKYSMF